MKKISISFSRFSDVVFLNKAQVIYDSLNGNPHFTTLAALLLLVAPALDKYTIELAAAASRDRIAVAKKNQSRSELEALMSELGMAVMAEAKGNEPLLVESGYTLYKNREASQITNPGNVTLSHGVTSGELVSMVKTVAGAKSYVHQITSTMPEEGTDWASNTSSTSRYVFNNLVPGQQYWIRVAVVGSRNQVAYSPVGTWFAQ